MSGKETMKTAIKGGIIGATMLVPGCSGGSMAMILGIYEKLVTSVSTLFQNFKKNLFFLIVFVMGAGVGMLLFAKPLLTLIENYPKPMLFFFMGAVAGGVPLIYKEAKIKKYDYKVVLYVAIGLILILLMGLLPSESLFTNLTGWTEKLVLVVAGVVAAVALILPGISVSYMLLLLGIYDSMVQAISELDILYLLPLAIGVGAGILLTTKGLEYVMKKFPQPTYLIILGFILGSLRETFPGLPIGVVEWIVCICTLAAGFVAIYFLSKVEEK